MRREREKNIELLKKPIPRWLQVWTSIAVAIIAASWAVGVYVSDRYFAHQQETAHISIKSELNEIGRKNDLVAIKLLIHLKNESKKRIWILPSAYAVYGISYDQIDQSESKYIKSANDYLIDTTSFDGPLSRIVSERDRELIAAGLLIKSWYFDPLEETNASYTFYCSHKHYDEVLIMMEYITAEVHDGVDIRWKISDEGELESTIVQNEKSGRILLSDGEEITKKFIAKKKIHFLSKAVSFPLWDINKKP